MRVDDLGFLFQVESLLMALDLGLCKLAVVILTVVREQRFWVGVSDETISAASLTCALIASWQTRKRILVPNGLLRFTALKAVFTMVFSKAAMLLTLRRQAKLRGTLRIKVIPSGISLSHFV